MFKPNKMAKSSSEDTSITQKVWCSTNEGVSSLGFIPQIKQIMDLSLCHSFEGQQQMGPMLHFHEA
jgi:hypothetical protein